MSNKSTYLTDDLYEYLQAVSVRPDAILQELSQKNSSLKQGHMQIAPEQGQFIDLLLKLINAKRTLEIGVFTGYSTLVTARALPENGEVIACDISEEWTNIAREYWKKANVMHKINLKIAPAEFTLKQLIAAGEKNQFDFAFIDADKTSNEVYYELCLELIRSNGLILIDNVFMHYGVLNQDKKDKTSEAIRQLSSKLLHDERVDISMLPVADGVTLIRKR